MTEIKGVKLTNFRQFRDASIELQAGINLIVGGNGEGKSNLLYAILLALNQQHDYSNCITTAENADYAQIDVQLTDSEVKCLITPNNIQYILNNKQLNKQALEMQLAMNILHIKQSQSAEIATLSPRELFLYFQNVATMQDYHQKITNLQNQLKDIKTKRNNSQELILEFRESLSELDQQKIEYEQYQAIKDEINQIQVIIDQQQQEQIEAEIDTINRQIDECKKAQLDNTRQIGEYEVRLGEVKEQIDVQNSNLSISQLGIENMKVAYQQLLQNPDLKYYEQKNQISKRLEEAQNSVQSNQDEIDKYQLKLFKYQARAQKNQPMSIEQQKQLQLETGELRSQLQELQRGIEANKAKQMELTAQLAGIRTSSYHQQQSAINAVLIKQERGRRNQRLLQIDVQRSYEELYQCYNKTQSIIMERVQELNEQKRITGYLGLFGQLISVDESLFTVLEQAGGAILGQIVMDTTENAMKLIKQIQELSITSPELRGCRMNILVAEDFKAGQQTLSFQSQIQSQQNAVSLATLVSCSNSTIQNIVDTYFTRVLVVKTFQMANEFSTRYQADCYTLEGDCVLHSGLVNAGFNVATRVRCFNQLNTTIQKLKECQLQLDDLEQQERALQADLEKCKDEHTRQQDVIASLSAVQNEIKMAAECIQRVTTKIRQQEYLLEQDMPDAGDNNVGELDIADIKQIIDQLNRKHIQLQNTLFELQQRSTNLSEIDDLLQSLRARGVIGGAQGLEQIVSTIKCSIQGQEQQQCQTMATIEELQHQQLQVEQHLAEDRAKGQELEESARTLSDNMLAKQQQLNQLQRRSLLLPSQAKPGNLPEHVLNNQGNKAYLQQYLQQLNNKIGQFGAQDSLLFETFEQKQRELQEAESEMEKFVKAENEVEELLERIDQRHHDELNNNFQIVSGQFRQIFGYLTGLSGGIAINIKAQELRFDTEYTRGGTVAIGELSGGQQAVLSLSLLLSLGALDSYQVYALDEVDSNLDGDVRLRFYELLEQKTQQEHVQVVVTSFRGEAAARAARVVEVANGTLRVAETGA